jgi:hypothetical protein
MVVAYGLFSPTALPPPQPPPPQGTEGKKKEREQTSEVKIIVIGTAAVE